MIISIKSSARGGSSRGLVHYLAHSKLDRAKEGVEKREFFNESENDLDVRRANKHLSLDNARPKPEELLHIVIAPGKEEIAKLGADRDEQKDALKEVVRETVAQLEKEVNAKNLKWVAAVHFNTENPHAHLAVQKEFINQQGKAETLRINRQMLHYNEADENGNKKLRKGTLILAAENKIEEIAKEKENSRETEKIPEPEKLSEKIEAQPENSNKIAFGKSPEIPNFRERRIMAEEMLFAADIAQRNRNIENLIEHGDKKRFKIKDERTGQVRHLSHFDLERKIADLSRQKAFFAHPKSTEKREQYAAKVAESLFVEHEPVFKKLETIRRHVLGFENRHLAAAREKHTQLHNQKLLIEKKYERQNLNVPLPLFNPDEIQYLQNEAVNEKNAEKFSRLEKIRQQNSLELNQPSRRTRDLRELLAAKIIAKLKLAAGEKRLLDFSEKKEFAKVKIGASFWSHRELHRHEIQNAKENNFWTHIKSKTNRIFSRSDGKSKPSELLDYPALHKAVDETLEKIENLRRDEIVKQKEFCQTLDQIFNAETISRKSELSPAFSAFELAEIEDLANQTARENLYENSLDWQESWLSESLDEKIGQLKPADRQKTEVKTTRFQSQNQDQISSEKIIGNFVLGRAKARSLLARIKVDQAEENLAQNGRDKSFIKHRVKNPQTDAEFELSLKDVEPNKHYYLLDRVLEKLLETKAQKNLRRQIRQAAQNREKELRQNLTAAQIFAQNLENQKSTLSEKFSTAENVQPIFTPKEIATLTSWKDRTADKSKADLLEKTINEAENKGRVGKLGDFLEKTAKELESLAPQIAKNPQLNIFRQSDLTGQRNPDGFAPENKQESEIMEKNIGAKELGAKAKLEINEKSAIKERERSR